MNAHPTMTHTAPRIGIAAVLVQAKDEAAKAWYLRQAKFMAFPEDGRVLWLPVVTVVGGVGST
ncbi:MAG: Gnat family [Rhodobacteraceae bacterium]|nr:MAG: Gnat family [Paracoccaceae bacterium]